MDFWVADDVTTGLATEIINQYRPELKDVTIIYYFKEKAGKKVGKLILATAKKVSPKDNVIHSFEGKPDVVFAVEIAADTWNALSDIQKRAVLHHELCHCGFESDDLGNLEPVIMPHDIEEFSTVVEEHGYYMKDIQEFAATVLEKEEKDKEKDKKVEKDKKTDKDKDTTKKG
jgi:hypothetical protein